MAATGSRAWADNPTTWKSILGYLDDAEARKGPRKGALLMVERMHVRNVCRAMMHLPPVLVAATGKPKSSKPKAIRPKPSRVKKGGHRAEVKKR